MNVCINQSFSPTTTYLSKMLIKWKMMLFPLFLIELVALIWEQGYRDVLVIISSYSIHKKSPSIFFFLTDYLLQSFWFLQTDITFFVQPCRGVISCNSKIIIGRAWKRTKNCIVMAELVWIIKMVEVVKIVKAFRSWPDFSKRWMDVSMNNNNSRVMLKSCPKETQEWVFFSLSGKLKWGLIIL